LRIHLDTDIGSDPDDACALAMLAGWPGVELTGVTTTIDPGGRRAGFAARCLELAGRGGVPVAAGAEVSLTTLRLPGGIPPDERYWGGPVPRRPSGAGAAFDLIEASIDSGATLVAIGPFTNLALFEVARPGRLASVPVVLMGGWVAPPADGLPQWGPEADWNVQCDTLAAEIVTSTVTDLTLVTLAATARAHLREVHLPRLEAAGPLGRLLARQASVYAEDRARPELAAGLRGIPADLLNFHHDPLACAVAAGWDRVRAERLPLRPSVSDGVMRFVVDEAGRPATVVLDADGPAFEEAWLEAVARAG
jgi:purine nucleosidase